MFVKYQYLLINKWNMKHYDPLILCSVPSCLIQVTHNSNYRIICCRTRALTELERRLAGNLSELQNIQDASSRLGIPETREVEDVFEEATKAVAER